MANDPQTVLKVLQHDPLKVPGLRNVGRTGPYFHDGSVASLEAAVRMMAWHPLDRQLSDNETEDIVAFLGTLTGTLPETISPPARE